MNGVAVLLFLITYVFWFAVGVVYAFSYADWQFEKSPKSGICYERKVYATSLGASYSLSPVDDKFCEKEKEP